MSKPSRRPNREAIKAQRSKKKQQEKQLRAAQRAQGLTPQSHASHSNGTSPYDTVEAERQGRTEAVIGQMRILKAQLPHLLNRFSKIPDPRNPKKIKHSLTLLMLYGLFMFVLQHASRREVNRQMTHPQFKENLYQLFPELHELPHADTLFRLLSRIETDQIEQTLVELIKRLIKQKKFHRHLINNCYPIAIDGTQKMPCQTLWSASLLQRKKKAKHEDMPEAGQEVVDEQDDYQYYVYVLEANLAFQNGMVIPLLSEFLEYQQGDIENKKQDCEQRAFKRLAQRLKDYFPRLPILLLLDGLYANGPVMTQCLKYHWQFMIVLKDKSLPSVWEEFHALLNLNPQHDEQDWGIRHQQFKWVNEIEYYFGPNDRHNITLHVVTCDETWEVINPAGEKITRQSRHAWLSSRPMSRNNLHERCNLGARHRWGIEACILVEKHQGYHYEHCFALDWSAMKGYHYLMRLAHVFNTLTRFSKTLSEHFQQFGIQGFFKFVYSTLTGPWLNNDEVARKMNRPFQLRLE